jgi:transcriptional regulator with XRE-family HTH domain
MTKENTREIREKILSLVESEFESDAAFEREMGLSEKTVNNWRRGRSSSFMRILPAISERFDIGVGELLDMPIRGDTSELSDDERSLLTLYRKCTNLPPKMRAASKETLESTISLYVASTDELAIKPRVRKKRT